MRFNLNSSFRMSSKSIYTSASNSTSFNNPQFSTEQGTTSDGKIKTFCYYENFATCYTYQCNYQTNQPIMCSIVYYTLVTPEGTPLIPHDKNETIKLGVYSGSHAEHCPGMVFNNSYYGTYQQNSGMISRTRIRSISVYDKGELVTTIPAPLVGRGEIEDYLKTPTAIDIYKKAVRKLKAAIKY